MKGNGRVIKMGKTTKVIKVEVEKTVNTIICDYCGKDVTSGGYSVCGTCGRYLCRECFSNPKDEDKLKEISPRHPCKYCMEFIDEYYPYIKESQEKYAELVESINMYQDDWGKRSRGESNAQE